MKPYMFCCGHKKSPQNICGHLRLLVCSALQRYNAFSFLQKRRRIFNIKRTDSNFRVAGRRIKCTIVRLNPNFIVRWHY